MPSNPTNIYLWEKVVRWYPIMTWMQQLYKLALHKQLQYNMISKKLQHLQQVTHQGPWSHHHYT